MSNKWNSECERTLQAVKYKVNLMGNYYYYYFISLLMMFLYSFYPSKSFSSVKDHLNATFSMKHMYQLKLGSVSYKKTKMMAQIALKVKLMIDPQSHWDPASFQISGLPCLKCGPCPQDP